MSGGEALLFWVLGPACVLGALGLLFVRKAVHAAMAMAMVMVGLGIFYIAQYAEFVGIIQIFVYSGAVMMLFLFVVMTVGVGSTTSSIETIGGQRIWGWILALLFMGLAMFGLGKVTFPEPVGLEAAQSEGTVTALAREIFSHQVFSFEVLGSLLVIAVMGAMVLAHRERLTPKRTQRELAANRIRSNTFVAGKPAPGVYARHNASDTPALLPDGTPAEHSVPRVLVARGQAQPVPYQGVDPSGDPTETEAADRPVPPTTERGEQA
ncbi:NADH-quinone oxidoreductase subunit J [Ornithinimicrobium faecis]|uniref:NADH-quinone oxidoreductase subunit J n=1 Tax=Ornithinimicrobium faecis TaxID=2934158 RepID=A0ABY4YX63_9MICO|nr:MULTISPECIES: NADH-quinone oxidoreductase subunit J [unclassified Ornithinimicrobium]USQ80825.1 NADH-quinone oxidoreductase subunit J [Ornithinimicrobium sp. HY1793]